MHIFVARRNPGGFKIKGMTKHITIEIQAPGRGFHIITSEIMEHLPELPQMGYFMAYIKHTSAGLCINESFDSDVLHDFELYMNEIVREDMPGLKHTVEGPDDMPSHVKSSLVGHSISIPIIDGKLAMGTWQGIYLCEFRNNPRPRSIILSILS